MEKKKKKKKKKKTSHPFPLPHSSKGRNIILTWLTLLKLYQFLLTFTTLWANSADDKMVVYSYFSEETGFDILCKLSPMETICMDLCYGPVNPMGSCRARPVWNVEYCFLRKTRKKNQNFVSSKFYPECLALMRSREREEKQIVLSGYNSSMCIHFGIGKGIVREDSIKSVEFTVTLLLWKLPDYCCGLIDINGI